MASNAEMRRLVLHAADRLAEAPAQARLAETVSGTGYADRPAIAREALSITAAMALAEGTLRMVAACLADDEPEDGRAQAVRSGLAVAARRSADALAKKQGAPS